MTVFDSGHDPDGVSQENKAEESPPLLRQPSVKHDGPIAPLIDSTSDLDLNSVALSPDQVRLYFVIFPE